MLSDFKYPRPNVWLYLLVGCWAILVGTGLLLLTNFVNQPGPSRAAPVDYPQTTAVNGISPNLLQAEPADNATYHLAMFVHPHCPCSNASVRELARLMTSCQGRLTATVYCYRPDAESDQWIEGILYDSAAEIPGVIVQSDPAGGLARQFGAETSGQVTVYDPGGKLCFQGGITAGRGHEGDNLGAAAVLNCVLEKQTNPLPTVVPVFGCELHPASKKGT